MSVAQRNRLFFAFAFSIVVLISASTAAEGWVSLGSPYYSIGKFDFKVPDDWRMRPPIADVLFLTRDGLWLQLIRIGQTSRENPFSYISKTLERGVTPEQIAELVVEELGANRFVSNFNLLEKRTTHIAGVPALRIMYSYEGDYSVKKLGVYYGCLLGDSFYFFQYQAPARHYFERHLQTFEDIMRSMKISD